MRRLGIACMLLFVLSLTACSPGDATLRSGDTFTTQSGLTLTLPKGSSATVWRPEPAQIQSDVPFTELVDVTLDDEHYVSLLSFKNGGRNSLDASLVAGSPDSEVALMDQGVDSIPGTIETQVDGAAPGRVILLRPAGSSESRRNLTLARWVWDRLEIRGAELPDNPQ